MAAALNRPNVIARGVTLLAVAVCVVAVALLVAGGSSYDLKLQLANASGLRPGSQVLLGGVSVGTVDSLNLDSRNMVIADLHLNQDQVHLGSGAKASIIAANLLGEEYVALNPGDASHPLPSGSTLPQASTTPQTDLDRVINVLDGGTRARLAILLQEAGAAVAGRRSDVNAILRQFPLSLTAATNLLTTMVQDNHTLSDLVANSNGFISRINQQSSELKQVIGASAGAMTTLALRAGDLQQAVIGAPKTLQVLHDFFGGGANSANALVKAAGLVADTAPAVNELLTAVKPFTKSAVPTLNRAAEVAPALSKLAVEATPTVKQAVPTISSLENIARLANPLSAWLGLSSQDLISIPANWSKAIQYRDGLSHIFGGEIYLDPQIVLGVANQGASPAQRRQNLLDVLNPAIVRTLGLVGAQKAARDAGGSPTKSQGSATTSRGSGGGLLGGVLGGLGGGGSSSPSSNAQSSSSSSTASGPPSGGGSSGSSGTGSSGSGGSAPGGLGSTLQNLLGFLLGK